MAYQVSGIKEVVDTYLDKDFSEEEYALTEEADEEFQSRAHGFPYRPMYANRISDAFQEHPEKPLKSTDIVEDSATAKVLARYFKPLEKLGILEESMGGRYMLNVPPEKLECVKTAAEGHFIRISSDKLQKNDRADYKQDYLDIIQNNRVYRQAAEGNIGDELSLDQTTISRRENRNVASSFLSYLSDIGLLDGDKTVRGIPREFELLETFLENEV